LLFPATRESQCLRPIAAVHRLFFPSASSIRKCLVPILASPVVRNGLNHQRWSTGGATAIGDCHRYLITASNKSRCQRDKSRQDLRTIRLA
jgi:hypothetical protein